MADNTKREKHHPTLKRYQSSTFHDIQLIYIWSLSPHCCLISLLRVPLESRTLSLPPSLIVDLGLQLSGFLYFPSYSFYLNLWQKMVVAMASGRLGAQTLLINDESVLLRVRGRFTKGVLGFSAASRMCVHQRRKLSVGMTTIIPRASLATAVEDGNSETEQVPTPKVIIDLDSDPDATVVEMTFGDRLGVLLDTMNALKNLGLNVVKANVFLDSSGKHNTFAITRADTGRKVDDPELLEAIRLTIINNLLEYHPESSAQLAMGAAFGITPAAQQVDIDIATHVKIVDDGPERSLLYVETADRPGLLVDLVKIITDINVAVESGEFDTEGLLAKAKFHVSYKGKALIKPLQQVVANSLRYYLRRPSTEEASF